MLTPKFLEGMNGTLFILVILACFMFCLYIYREVRKNGYARSRLQAAISVLVFLFGEAVIRGWVWCWRHLENAGYSTSWMEHSPVLLLGAFIEIVGVVCVIRVFAPDSWGRNVWFASVIVAIGVAVAFMYL